MSILTILQHPDPRLRTKATPVEHITAEIKAVVADMFETMYATKGIGLAATQVDIHKRIFIEDVSEDQSAPLVFINPEIIAAEGHEESEEGCLSVPGIYEVVKKVRAQKVTVRALDLEGHPFELEADGLLGKCIQHEIDHLNGILFIDYLSPLKRQRAEKKLYTLRRETL